MKLSPDTRYAIRFLFELRDARRPLSLAAIAEATGVSLKVAERIHAVFKRHDITSSAVGPKGGISLEVPLEKISLGAIIDLFDNGVRFAVCRGEKSNDCPNQDVCENKAMWLQVSTAIQEHLDNIPLTTILKDSPGKIVPLPMCRKK